MCSIGSSTLTISTLAQTTVLTACPTFTGSVAVVDAIGAANLTLPNIEQITGNFTVNGVTQLSQFSAASLRNITGNLFLQNLPALLSLDFPQLAYAKSVFLNGTGSGLVEMHFPNLTETPSIEIYKTSLKDLNDLGLRTSSYVQILNNPSLANITIPLETCNYIDIEANWNGQASISLPQLIEANSLSVYGSASLSVPLLRSAGIDIYGNPSMTELSFPALEYSSSFEVFENVLLKNISAPMLRYLINSDAIMASTGLEISGNPNVAQVSFPQLQQLSGGTIEGNLTSVELAALTSVYGSLNIKSTYSSINTSCTQLEGLGNSVFKGGLTCVYPGSPAPKTNRSATIGGAVGGVVALFVIAGLGIVGGWYCRMRRRARKGQVGWEGQGEAYELR